MTNNKKSIFLGLAFPNAVLFGLALMFLGCFGLYQTYLTGEVEISFGLIVKTVLLSISFLLGLIPFSSTKHIQFDSEFIYSYKKFYFILKAVRKLRINDYMKVIVKKGNKTYQIESGLRPTAKSEYSLKLYDIVLRSKSNKDTVLVSNIGSQKKTKKVLDEILSRTDYDY